MGVTYKLRQDVVEFITASKKNDPALSCRKLVVIIKESFGLDVSKSSVNDVMKASELSAPIGRPSLRKPPKNFSIPDNTKQLLLKNVQPFLTPGEEPQPAEAADSDPIVSIPVTESTPKKSLSFEEVPATSETEPPAVTLIPDPVADQVVFPHESPEEVLEKIEALSSKAHPVLPPVADWPDEPSLQYGRLGGAVLWYALEAACPQGSHPGEKIARALGALPDGIGPRECAMALFAGFYTEHRPGFESDDLRTLCRFAGIQESTGRALLERTASLDHDRALVSIIHSELQMSFTSARYFRLLTKNGGRYYVDAAFPVLHENAVDAGQVTSMLPLFIAVERIVDSCITNIVPLVADVRGYGITPSLLSFIRLMDFTGDDEITGFEVIGDNDIKCAEFTAVPRMRRSFIFRVNLTREELARVDYGLIDNSKTFTSPHADQEWRFYEGTLAIEGLSSALRVLVVKQADGAEITLVSNISPEKASAESLLARFAQAGMAGDDQNSMLALVETVNTPPEMTVISRAFRVIDTYARRFFLGSAGSFQAWEEICSVLYDMPGRMKETPHEVLIYLEPPEGFAFNAQLAFFLRRLNSAALKTPDARLITFLLRPLPPA